MHQLTLAEITRALAAKQFSAEELTRSLLTRIQQLDPQLLILARAPGQRDEGVGGGVVEGGAGEELERSGHGVALGRDDGGARAGARAGVGDTGPRVGADQRGGHWHVSTEGPWE